MPTALARSVRRTSYLRVVLAESARAETTQLDILAPRLAPARAAPLVRRIQDSWAAVVRRGVGPSCPSRASSKAAAETGQATPYTGDVVAAGMRLADAVVVLLTPDDICYVQPRFRLAGDGRHELEPTGQPRLNVVFEAGMAMARDRDKVVLVEVGHLRPMSDTTGLNVVRLADDAATRRHGDTATRRHGDNSYPPANRRSGRRHGSRRVARGRVVRPTTTTRPA